MNIFYLDESPRLAAQAHCDKHVVKMILETAQILSTVIHKNSITLPGIYRPTHQNHPCTIWAGYSPENFKWLYQLGYELCEEYYYRYGRIHKTFTVIQLIKSFIDTREFNSFSWSSWEASAPALAMPDVYKTPDPVQSYKNYYINEKREIAQWSKGRNAPSWWVS